MTSQYTPVPPNGEDPAKYAYDEFQDLARALSEASASLPLQVVNVEPDKPRDGMIVHFGATYNPGTGAGPYARIAGAWVPLFTGGGAGSGANLSYTASTRVIASDTGTDATLPLVSSGDAGLAPAGSLNDGDKGDISVSGTGTVWNLDLKLNEIDAPTGSVNFNDQQATSFRLENRTSDPGTPTTGQIWLRTDL